LLGTEDDDTTVVVVVCPRCADNVDRQSGVD
jgi:hypothetical protein